MASAKYFFCFANLANRRMKRGLGFVAAIFATSVLFAAPAPAVVLFHNPFEPGAQQTFWCDPCATGHPNAGYRVWGLFYARQQLNTHVLELDRVAHRSYGAWNCRANREFALRNQLFRSAVPRWLYCAIKHRG